MKSDFKPINKIKFLKNVDRKHTEFIMTSLARARVRKIPGNSYMTVRNGIDFLIG